MGKLDFLRRLTPAEIRNEGSREVDRPPVEVLFHAVKIRDYLWRSEAVSNEYFKCERLGQPHIYDSVAVLDRWLRKYKRELKEYHPSWVENLGQQIKDEGPRLRAFILGAALAVLFFLPEILGVR
ncbi:MAG: hypothetical protein L0Z50_09850 [Verrucomicrobiales bacterium]|nr:hypothetical protein [Verrucomicrobiales bacterium]